MAYVSGFKHDLFISYSHVDNLTAEGGPGWVERFHKYLQLGLDRRLGRMGSAVIWRDQRLEPIQEFDQTIFEALESSAVFLALVSNGYLASDYCLEEARRFHRRAREDEWGLKIGDRRRMAIALLDNTPHQSWPEEFHGTSGAPFHDAERPDDLGDPTAPGDQEPFKGQVKTLRDSLWKLLLSFGEASAPEPRPAPAAGPAVFVADVVDSQRAARERLVGELERKEIRVLDAVPPPWEAAEHRTAVEGRLADAILSVHLLGPVGGRPIQGEESSTYVHKQVELAGEAGGGRLIWVPKDLDTAGIEDDAHRELIDRLEHGERQEGSGHEFVRGSQTVLAAQIAERLEALTTRAATPEPGAAVLLDTHLKDQLHALELSKLLLEANVQPYINPQEDDPRTNLDVLEARLREVKTLMILYGGVHESWVRERLGAALQLSVTKGLALESFCVYLAPPHKTAGDLDFSFGPVRVPLIDNSANPTPQPGSLAPLLATLGGAAG